MVMGIIERYVSVADDFENARRRYAELEKKETWTKRENLEFKQLEVQVKKLWEKHDRLRDKIFPGLEDY